MIRQRLYMGLIHKKCEFFFFYSGASPAVLAFNATLLPLWLEVRHAQYVYCFFVLHFKLTEKMYTLHHSFCRHHKQALSLN